MILLYEALRLVKFVETEIRIDVSRGWCLMGTVSVWDDKKVLELDMAMVVQYCECTVCRRTIYLKMVKIVNFMSCIQ